jgi:photosystem II stability/assembly factor-like uncharacterized protein
METNPDLEYLYQQAQKALSAGKEAEASELLKQILLIDDNYKDAAQLLAELVARQRRRWYNDRRLWIGIAGLVAIPLSLLLIGQFRSLPSALPPPPTTPATWTASQTPRPTASSTSCPTLTPRPSPTPISLAWRRIDTGEQFSRSLVTTIVFDPRDREVIYIGTDSAGVYKSIDGGLSWQPAHQGLGRAQISSLVIDPDEPHTLYAGVVLAGVYKSTDGARSWHAVNTGIDLPGGEWISIVVMDPQDSKHLYYTHAESLYETLDSGKHWTQIRIDNCPSEISDLVVHPIQAQTLFATEYGWQGYCKAGVYKSDDGGATWKIQLGAGMGTGFRTLEIDSERGEFLAAVTWDGQTFYSIDGGDSWTSPNVTCQHLTFSPFDPTIWYCASQNILRVSQDKGQSWRPTHPLSTLIQAVAPVPPNDSGSVLVGGQGLFLSTDGGASWLLQSDGLGASRMELYVQPGEDPSLFVDTGTQELYRSPDSGRTWELVIARSGSLSFDVSGKILYQGLTRSEDDGKTWRTLNMPEVSFGLSTLSADTRNEGVVYFAAESQVETPGFYFYVSSDSGRTWTGGLQKPQVCHPKVFSSFGDDLVLYVIGCHEALRSMDGGSTWHHCGEETWFPRTSARLAIDPENSGHLLAATRGEGVWLSYDSCQSWIKIDEWRGLTNLYVNAVVVDTRQPETVYAGTDGGAYVSFDSGEHWGEINEGLLGATVVYSIVVDPQSNVYAVTPYGIFRLESR